MFTRSASRFHPRWRCWKRVTRPSAGTPASSGRANCGAPAGCRWYRHSSSLSEFGFPTGRLTGSGTAVTGADTMMWPGKGSYTGAKHPTGQAIATGIGGDSRRQASYRGIERGRPERAVAQETSHPRVLLMAVSPAFETRSKSCAVMSVMQSCPARS